MEIPEFITSDTFLHGVPIRCLKATARNGSLPGGLAARHIADSKTDPEFPVYLRGTEVCGISDWQQGVLDHLFKREGLPIAVQEGMKALEHSVFGAYEAEREVQVHGMLPFLYILSVVIDEVRSEVIISLDTEKGFKPHEREIVLYRPREAWKFDDGDYIDRYLTEVAVDEFMKQMGDGDVKSPTDADGVSISDPSVLYGQWLFDETSTAEIDRLSRGAADEAESFASLRGLTYEFSTGRLRSYVDWHVNFKGALWSFLGRAFLRLSGQKVPRDCEYLGCEVQGNRVTISTKEVGGNSRAVHMYRLGGDKLVLLPEAWVLSRKTKEFVSSES
jgi:hypothetical protein